MAYIFRALSLFKLFNYVNVLRTCSFTTSAFYALRSIFVFLISFLYCSAYSSTVPYIDASLYVNIPGIDTLKDRAYNNYISLSTILTYTLFDFATISNSSSVMELGIALSNISMFCFSCSMVLRRLIYSNFREVI